MNNNRGYTSNRAEMLANRLLEGAKSLAKYVEGLSIAEWNKPVKGDGRSIGVVVHHVASVYPVEIELAEIIASGKSITDVTKEAIDSMNAEHAEKYANVGKDETLELMKKNSADAAKKVSLLSDEDLDNAELVSLNSNAPLTTQFFIEDHALRHSFHHLAYIKDTLGD